MLTKYIDARLTLVDKGGDEQQTNIRGIESDMSRLLKHTFFKEIVDKLVEACLSCKTARLFFTVLRSL